jgi:recombinational DNA repair protein RecR
LKTSLKRAKASFLLNVRVANLIGHVVRGKIAEIIFALPADVEGEATTN